jgi:hypothetical protein
LAAPSRALHPLLLDPRYWRERLEIAQRTPRQLLVFPRQDLSWPGGEVTEFWLKAHDGERLQALFARSLFGAPRPRLLAQVIGRDSQGAVPAPAPALTKDEGFNPDKLRTYLRLASGELPSSAPNSNLEGLESHFDWDRIRDGEAHLLLVRRAGRKLEDRVLDLVRAVGAARQVGKLATRRVELATAGSPEDELKIAGQLFEQGWA